MLGRENQRKSTIVIEAQMLHLLEHLQLLLEPFTFLEEVELFNYQSGISLDKLTIFVV